MTYKGIAIHKRKDEVSDTETRYTYWVSNPPNGIYEIVFCCTNEQFDYFDLKVIERLRQKIDEWINI